MDVSFLLVHSPSVGPSTWRPVAEALRARGHTAVVPPLVDVTAGPPPYWPRVVGDVVTGAPRGPLAIVAHSNAGLFVPLIAEALTGQISACLFVDAALPPRTGSVQAAEPEFVPFLRSMADESGLLPRWTDWWPEEDVAALLPDRRTREVVVAEQPRLPLAYYLEEIPVPSRWDHVRSAYLWFGEGYATLAKEAAERGWPVDRIPGEHLHQLVAPGQVADWLVATAT
ncbi:alpha/beta hydrolase [Microbispora sp. NPDC049125]|uniref:alpha/beta hydrolase n=1 Tax=Microbispora sp. NPDC049125 TaxID=3154929 RepID=UPI0034656B3F